MRRIPRLGLLLDVDGPIASPLTRRIDIAGIVADLVRLAGMGVPIVFNTGRAETFIRHEIFAPLCHAGASPGARIHAVCEKGAVWLSLGDERINVDGTLVVPADYGVQVQELVAERYDETMFYDQTKHAMVSAEQHVHVPSGKYLAAQVRFEQDALQLLMQAGMGVAFGNRNFPGPEGRIDYRLESSIISTDIEAIGAGKDLGAARALQLLSADGPLPQTWRTMGDSRSDYLMADWLYAQGYEVAHIDVRPAEGIPHRPYPVRTAGYLIHDEAGAHYLRRWVRMLGGEAARRG